MKLTDFRGLISIVAGATIVLDCHLQNAKPLEKKVDKFAWANGMFVAHFQSPNNTNLLWWCDMFVSACESRFLA